MKNEIINENKNEYELTIWKNGKNVDSCTKLKISDEINSIFKLKELILISRNKINNIAPDKIRLFNQKGFELEDADLKLLKDSLY